MAIFCITLPVANKLKQALRNGTLSIQGLYAMTSAQREAAFAKISDAETGKQINVSLERAMVSKQKNALQGWAKKVFTPSSKGYNTVMDKINELDKMGVLNPKTSRDFLSGLVEDKLGISVTPAEVKTIAQKARDLEAAFAVTDADGIPTDPYWSQRKEMDDYLNSLTPTNRLKVATSTSGRGAMLLSVKSPLTNIISNTAQGIVQGMQRRISTGQYKGLNGDYAIQYVKKTSRIYQKSGYDISRMDGEWMGQKRLGEDITHAQGPGVVRRVGRFYEDVVFKQLMGAPDVAFSAAAFADAADLASSKIAKSEGLTGQAAKSRALEIFKEAAQIKNENEYSAEAQIVRSQAIADARYSTYTNKGGYSDVAMAIRTALNKASGNVRLGDQLMPFVKTPANVIQAGVDAAGVGAIKGFYKLPGALKALKLGDNSLMRDVVQNFVRTGLGMTLATVLAYAIDPDDFVGAYDSINPKGRQQAKLKNAPYNSIRVGDKWVSLDYMGPLAAPFVGIMYARKYGDTLPEKIFAYSRGVGGQAAQLPGLEEFATMVDETKKTLQRGKFGDVKKGLTDEAVAYIRSRTIPAIVNDFGQATDRYQRKTGQSELSKTQAAIPGMRQKLPIRTDQTTGQPMRSEPAWSVMLFGSRLKTAAQGKVVDELTRLYGAGVEPNITDIEYSSSSRVKALKEKLPGREFQQAVQFFQKTYGEKVSAEMEKPSYLDSSDDEKKEMVDDSRNEALDEMLAKYGYGTIARKNKMQRRYDRIAKSTRIPEDEKQRALDKLRQAIDASGE
jgi:hypothetical protein